MLFTFVFFGGSLLLLTASWFSQRAIFRRFGGRGFLWEFVGHIALIVVALFLFSEATPDEPGYDYGGFVLLLILGVPLALNLVTALGVWVLEVVQRERRRRRERRKYRRG